MRLLTVSEAADFLGLSKSTLYKRTCARAIPFYKLGSRVLFEEDALVAWTRMHHVPMLGHNFTEFEEDYNDAV